MQPGLFDPDRPPYPKLDTLRTTESTHILTPGNGRTGAYDFALNAYRGCGFGCHYCYAAAFVGDERQREAWGTWVEVKRRAVAVLRRRDLAGKAIYMSSVTDPYQPVERTVELTRAVVEELLRQQARLVVQTRSPLVTRDIDLFGRFENLRVNLSITTDDDEVRRRFEPACASIERRLAAAAELKKSGICVSVCVSPMLPMADPGAFGRRLTEIGVDHVTASWFHQSDRLFTASTRAAGWQDVADAGWTQAKYQFARQQLAESCPAFGSSAAAFGPV